ATFYQIYVRSWRDSNDDGIGDLAGVCEGLDYLKWLGVDAVWLSPTMPSPNTDWGYDVSDYYGVHPDLGTLEDLDRLIEEAGQRDIGVMLDLVPNHTSSAHPWFVDALSDPGSARRGYYVWAPARPGGDPPNNWLDATGAPAWTWDEPSQQFYLHNFLPTQPDLNWWTEAVHKEFEDILNFWFARGVAGFRIDVAHGLYKDAQLRDNPPPRPTDHPVVRAGKLRPEYNSHRPEVHAVYQRWRQIADGYQPQRALLGETWEFDPERFAAFYGREKPELHLGFNFPFVMAELRAPDLAAIVEATLAVLPPGATPVWTASNHDVGRFPTRWCRDDPRAVKAALMVLASLPGTLVLYYGDELGMADVDVPLEHQRDEISLAQPGKPSRDRCRTPMPWSAGKNAGFTAEGAHPWLPLGGHGTTNVHHEQADPGSVLHFWRQLSLLRRSGRIGAVGPLERVLLNRQVWAYRAGGAITVANLSHENATYEVGDERLRVLAATDPGRQGSEVKGEIGLHAWEALALAAAT
ncbi:MAG: alpha-amylase family glycosyl hydrolase, partial [Acidimicrobiales bacterium]